MYGKMKQIILMLLLILVKIVKQLGQKGILNELL